MTIQEGKATNLQRQDRGTLSHTLRFFEKNRVKLLVKYRDSSRYFGNKYKLPILSLLLGEGAEAVGEADEGKIRK